MKHLYQPVYEYEKEVFGRKFKSSFTSSIVYETEERARLRAHELWNEIMSEGEKLLDIKINELILGQQ